MSAVIETPPAETPPATPTQIGGYALEPKRELIKDALKNVWSIPDPNSQVIVQPGRLSANSGVSRVINIGWSKVSLPDLTTTWHVYQIGQIHPLLLNLFDIKEKWTSLAEACNRRQLVCNVYNQYGIAVPLSRSYYLRMPDNNLVVAVEKNAKLGINIAAEVLYLRIYRNQYFQSSLSEEAVTIEVDGGKMLNNGSIMALTDRINEIRSDVTMQGQVLCFVNGRKVETINVANTTVGDVAEYLYDASIYNLIDYKVQQLSSFRSTLDHKSKWLLHADAEWDGGIDHCFNVDVYLYDRVSGKGVYVHKNTADTLRMVTFKDYSISSDYVQAYFPKFVDPVTGNLLLDNLYLRLHVRQDSYRQVPYDDVNKTKYLLRLSHAQQAAAMVGIDSSNTIWRAENLENSPYNRLMEARYENVTLGLVESAYGYSNANRILCPNIQECEVTTGGGVAPPTVLLHFNEQTDCVDSGNIPADAFNGFSIGGADSGGYIGAVISDNDPKFGDFALRFYAPDYTYARSCGNRAIPTTGDFTLEAWVRSNELPSPATWYVWDNPEVWSEQCEAFVPIFAHDAADWDFLSLDLMHDGTLKLKVGGNSPTEGRSSLTVNPWEYYHIALTRLGDTFTVWLNGQNCIEINNDISVPFKGTSNRTWLGHCHSLDSRQPNLDELGVPNASDERRPFFDGSMDEVRLVFGQAMYTSPFTPQESPFTVVSAGAGGGLVVVPVPVGFMRGSTAYEYSAAGRLLGIYPVDPNVGEYVCTQAASFVEFIEGTAGRTLHESYDDDSLTSNTNPTYPIITSARHFRCYEKIDGVWTDVTAGNTYRINGGQVRWNDMSANRRLIRSDRDHIAYEVTLNPNDGVLIHNVAYNQTNGVATMTVPMGEHDFWLNGYPLIEGIDYNFNFPQLEIISKEYLQNAPGPQVLTVRCFGLCRADLTPYRSKEVGFVFDGDMSVNDRYDLHENKSLRVISSGRLIGRSKQTFVEAVSSGLLNNGEPYEIRELCNAMTGFLNSDPYRLREANEVIEQKVSDYLTIKIRPTTDSPLNPIPDKYVLYSPFICKILFALKNGNIAANRITGSYPDSQVETVVAPYLPILKGDPIYLTNTPDLSYCVIHPHWLNETQYVTEDAFRFLTNVVRMYARNKVELSPLVAVGNNAPPVFQW